jgi:hypothetical protein
VLEIQERPPSIDLPLLSAPWRPGLPSSFSTIRPLDVFSQGILRTKTEPKNTQNQFEKFGSWILEPNVPSKFDFFPRFTEELM